MLVVSVVAVRHKRIQAVIPARKFEHDEYPAIIGILRSQSLGRPRE
jgi:hypothetical protein